MVSKKFIIEVKLHKKDKSHFTFCAKYQCMAIDVSEKLC